MWLNDIELDSMTIKLVPLSESHLSELVLAATDGELWKLWFTSVPSKENINEYISNALEQKSKGVALPFVVVEKSSGKVIGSTRFCNADSVNKRVEVGYTWYSKSFQRTSVNTECKLLLLKHAFETLDAIAVEFRTSWHNQASRAAIARLGAKQDGVLRNHQKLANGGYRDTVVFSIINTEWLSVKESLEFKLATCS
ncbi:putative Acyl-CoA N-acyltransferase [Vibrio nigripulchritudo SFn27]|nr:GNAT family protein [Vibrio nigripulchritudo]CCN85268.1 putative Acyl-CoA N-acyltransferase [Vibrio nigripulchritudo BLFn1]CCN87582.1 putative Acyl-CoA N-acyltransferase [Vibrio nigripulchritudo SFn27]CCN92463.1 putative Acyl-CoA N-acyltransferase [Vibrio nigripulchritudo ENn2]CCO39327.1 putative Acyl-CoA N-acyltransferase [Vibrio nigripulchritudo SFn135]CCO53445.1 putative Acyl-CoA N-acyltransferase [Vibrio nigripulchritudo Wn13]